MLTYSWECNFVGVLVFSLSKETNSYKTCFHGGHKFKREVYPRKTKKTEPPRIIMIQQYLKLHTVYRDELKNI